MTMSFDFRQNELCCAFKEETILVKNQQSYSVFCNFFNFYEVCNFIYIALHKISIIDA